jgi:hypothetical protein
MPSWSAPLAWTPVARLEYPNGAVSRDLAEGQMRLRVSGFETDPRLLV